MQEFRKTSPDNSLLPFFFYKIVLQSCSNALKLVRFGTGRVLTRTFCPDACRLGGPRAPARMCRVGGPLTRSPLQPKCGVPCESRGRCHPVHVLLPSYLSVCGHCECFRFGNALFPSFLGGRTWSVRVAFGTRGASRNELTMSPEVPLYFILSQCVPSAMNPTFPSLRPRKPAGA